MKLQQENQNRLFHTRQLEPFSYRYKELSETRRDCSVKKSYTWLQGALYTFGKTALARTAIGISLTAALLLSGCETGRTNKTHAAWQHLSDDTTTSKPESRQALGPGDHQPPVPGSPTAAGEDGNQPPDDMQARTRHGNEYGEAAAPHAQPPSSPERH